MKYSLWLCLSTCHEKEYYIEFYKGKFSNLYYKLYSHETDLIRLDQLVQSNNFGQGKLKYLSLYFVFEPCDLNHTLIFKHLRLMLYMVTLMVNTQTHVLLIPQGFSFPQSSYNIIVFLCLVTVIHTLCVWDCSISHFLIRYSLS